MGVMSKVFPAPQVTKYPNYNPNAPRSAMHIAVELAASAASPAQPAARDRFDGTVPVFNAGLYGPRGGRGR